MPQPQLCWAPSRFARRSHISFDALNCLVQCSVWTAEFPQSPDTLPPVLFVGRYPASTTGLIQAIHNGSGDLEIILSRCGAPRFRDFAPLPSAVATQIVVAAGCGEAA
jgi:hypothetical protein